MVPRVDGQRFCTRTCSDEFYQIERRQAVAYFRAQGLKPDLRTGEEKQVA